jgi:vitamin B12 transport system substrate-binding protein
MLSLKKFIPLTAVLYLSATLSYAGNEESSRTLPRLSSSTINSIVGVKKTIEQNIELEQKHMQQVKIDRDNINTIKIISLAPNITENLYSLGLGRNIVGIDSLSDYPAQVQSIPKVATVSNIDFEEILNLKPDLIVVWNDFFPNLEKDLKRYNIPARVFRFETHRITDFGDAILKLGRITHTEDRAIELRENFRSKIKELRNTYMNYPSHTVAYIIWDEPIYTVAENSWINDIIEICNGKNLFKKNDLSYPIIDKEFLMLSNPEIIINATIAHPMLNIPKRLQERAVILNKVNGMHRISTRTIDSAEEICQIIHQKDELIDENSSSIEMQESMEENGSALTKNEELQE